MKTTIGKLRNITTGILHTPVKYVYLFFEEYIGEAGIMTHHIPAALDALEPILKQKLSKEWFKKEWVTENLDEEVEIEDITEEELAIFWREFEKKNSNTWEMIKDKTIIINNP